MSNHLVLRPETASVLMIEIPQTDMGLQLDMELCRALYQKDPDRVIELVSEWLAANQLVPSQRFNPPDYLKKVLFEGPHHRLN